MFNLHPSAIASLRVFYIAEMSGVKIVLLGDSGVGKTSVASGYVSGVMPSVVKPTIGAAFVTKSIEIDNHHLELLIWDTAGQEVYRGLTPMYYRSAMVAIVMYDISSEATFNGVSYWFNELRANAEPDTIIILCGNKSDREKQRVIPESKGQALADTNRALFAETSAVTGAGVEHMFQMAVRKCIEEHGIGREKQGQTSVDLSESRSQPQCC